MQISYIGRQMGQRWGALLDPYQQIYSWLNQRNLLSLSYYAQLSEKLALWFRYVDDTFTFIKAEEIGFVTQAINSFHDNIKFTSVKEKENKLAFLDVQVERRDNGSLETSVYRKDSDTNIYINWKAYAPSQWKIGTLKGLFRRAFLICSNDESLDKEISHLKAVFKDINGYPSRIVHKTLVDVRKRLDDENTVEPPATTTDANNDNSVKTTDTQEITPHMTLPYKGTEGQDIIREFRKKIDNFIPKTVRPRIAFQGKKVNSFFQLKDKVKVEHQSNLIYKYSSGIGDPSDDYIGETNVRYEARVNEHVRTDKESAVYRHTKRDKITIGWDNFSIVAKGYENKRNRKVAEALYIKESKPSLNEQVKSYKLFLFND